MDLYAWQYCARVYDEVISLVSPFPSLPPHFRYVTSLFSRYVPVLMDTNPLAFGLVIGTKLCIYFTAMAYFVPGGTLTHYYYLQVETRWDQVMLVLCSVDLQVALVVSFGIFIMVKRSDAGRIPGSSPLESRRVSPKQLSCTACYFSSSHPDHC